VKASLKRAHQSDQEITCQTQDLVFLCELKKGKKFQVGDKVSITATRQGMSGNVALYSYPFQPPQVSASEEHKHHGTNH
jgi:hypothetical protein